VTTPQTSPATIAYVQSNGPVHDLGLVTSAGTLLNASLHRFAAAPAWSLDGTKIAFFGEERITELGSPYQEEGSGIWVAIISGVQASNLVRLDSPKVHIKNLAWSPNAARLAYEVHPPEVPAEIHVIDTNTGATISKFPGEQPAWKPVEGQQFAARNCPNLATGLCLINIDGSAARQLTREGTDSYPAWSPDGRYLVFASQRNGDWDIYRLEFDDNGSASELKQLTFSQYTEIAPVFSPDGQEIYFITDRYGDWRIVAADLNGENEHTIISGIGESNDWGLARPTIWQPPN
jgi:Tol biopolymer transport system component